MISLSNITVISNVIIDYIICTYLILSFEDSENIIKIIKNSI